MSLDSGRQPDIDLRDYEVRFPGASVPSGGQVILHINHSAIFGSRNANERMQGINEELFMTQKGGEFVYNVPMLEVGRTYQYFFEVVDSTGRRKSVGGSLSAPRPLRINALPASARPGIKLEAQRLKISNSVQNVLKAASTSGGMETIDALFQKFEMDIGGQTGNREGFLVDLLVDELKKNRTLPGTIKVKLEEAPVSSLADLKARWIDGAVEFRKKVKLRVLADKDASHSLHVHGSHFDHHAEEIINRICNEFDLSGALDYLYEGCQQLATSVPIDPVEVARRQVLAKDTAKRLKAHVDTVKPEKIGRLVRAGLQLGTFFAGGMYMFGGLTAMHALTGVGEKDLVEAAQTKQWGEFGKKILKENVGVDWWENYKNGQGTMGIARRFGRAAFLNIPGTAMIPFTKWGEKNASETVFGGGGHGDGHGDKHGAEHAGGHDEHKKPEDVLRTICRTELA